MSCIVGLVDNGTIYMGADSAGVNGSLNLSIRDDQKVFRKNDMIFGFTSSFRMGQLLRYSLEIPYHKHNVDIYEYMCTDFINAVRDCLKSGGYVSVDKGVEEGGFFLVGYKGQLFQVESDFQVGKTVLPYDSIGCGSPFALGSLYSTEGAEPRERILKALHAAQQFSAGVREPFHVIEL